MAQVIGFPKTRVEKESSLALFGIDRLVLRHWDIS